jgi:hypothetical protein
MSFLLTYCRLLEKAVESIVATPVTLKVLTGMQAMEVLGAIRGAGDTLLYTR